MYAFITTVILGAIVSLLGIVNMTGNISSLHWYHRHRVTEENKKPFGRLVGLGTLIIGIALILFGLMFMIYEKTKLDFVFYIAIVSLATGIAIGLIMSIYAMLKYNKGIF